MQARKGKKYSSFCEFAIIAVCLQFCTRVIDGERGNERRGAEDGRRFAPRLLTRPLDSRRVKFVWRWETRTHGSLSFIRRRFALLHGEVIYDWSAPSTISFKSRIMERKRCSMMRFHKQNGRADELMFVLIRGSRWPESQLAVEFRARLTDRRSRDSEREGPQ